MALLFVDGFDAGDTLLKWDPATNASGLTFPTTTRFGGGCTAYVYNGTLYKSFTASTQIFIGFAYKAAGTGNINEDFCRLLGDNGVTQHLNLRFISSSQLALFRGATQIATGTANFPLGSWSYVEIGATIADAGGTCVVRMDGVTVINFTGDTKNAGTNTTIDQLSLMTGFIEYAYFDDVYIANNTGPAPHNTFLGDIRIQTLVPNGPGSSTQFTPSAGANYAAVDEMPFSNTDYVTASLSGTQDLYTMTDLTSSASILAVQNNVIAKKADAGGTAMKSAIKSGSTVAYGPNVVLTASDRVITDTRGLDPATGTNWTQSGVNALEAGMEIA